MTLVIGGVYIDLFRVEENSYTFVVSVAGGVGKGGSAGQVRLVVICFITSGI